MSLKPFICCLIAGSALTLQAAKNPLNILFIYSDDHAAQTISAYGSKINKTPNIDRLARRGAVFVNSFCGNSLCGPSRATVLTGKHSHIHGFMVNEKTAFDGRQQTFPKLLQKAGYQTAIIGKWHLGSDPTGFDYWEILPNQGHYYNPNLYEKGENTDPKMWKWGDRYHGYVTDIITDLSIRWLEKRDKSRPFLLMCQHKAAHGPWAPPLKYLHLYDDVTIPEPPTLFDDYANRSKTLASNTTTIANYLPWRALKFPEFNHEKPNGETPRMTPGQKAVWDAAYGPKNRKMLAAHLSPKEMTKWRYQRFIKDYLRCVASIDENVGRLLDWLEQNNLMDSTVVIYSSDQGFFLGEHGWYDKRWMFEESLRTPLIIHWPGVTRPGSRIERLVQNIDYAPTFCDIAGITPPSDMQGKSLKPIILNPNAPWRDSIYYHYYEYPNIHNIPPHEGVRTERYKLINFYKNDGYNLFDLKNDPFEMKDVSKNPDYRGILTQMKRKLATLHKQYNVPPLNTLKIKPVLREPVYPLHREGSLTP